MIGPSESILCSNIGISNERDLFLYIEVLVKSEVQVTKDIIKSSLIWKYNEESERRNSKVKLKFPPSSDYNFNFRRSEKQFFYDGEFNIFSNNNENSCVPFDCNEKENEGCFIMWFYFFFSPFFFLGFLVGLFLCLL